jgi:cyanate permease
VIERIARDTAIVCGVLMVAAAVWARNAAAPLGVLGGTVLIGLSFWAIWGTVGAWIGPQISPETPPKRARFHLVKFFTRHGILALAAYGMMVRLHLDPVAMLVGVTALTVAVAVEAVRGLRWRRFP